LPAILFALVNIAILLGTLLPSDKIARTDLFDYDKAIHFLMFFVWTFLFGFVRAIQKEMVPRMWAVFLWGLSYGLAIEALQMLLPTNRSPELFDVIANGLGALTAVLLLRPLLRRWYPAKKEA
jgi:VanZ family protein